MTTTDPTTDSCTLPVRLRAALAQVGLGDLIVEDNPDLLDACCEHEAIYVTDPTTGLVVEASVDLDWETEEEPRETYTFWFPVLGKALTADAAAAAAFKEVAFRHNLSMGNGGRESYIEAYGLPRLVELIQAGVKAARALIPATPKGSPLAEAVRGYLEAAGLTGITLVETSDLIDPPAVTDCVTLSDGQVGLEVDLTAGVETIESDLGTVQGPVYTVSLPVEGDSMDVSCSTLLQAIQTVAVAFVEARVTFHHDRLAHQAKGEES